MRNKLIVLFITCFMFSLYPVHSQQKAKNYQVLKNQKFLINLSILKVEDVDLRVEDPRSGKLKDWLGDFCNAPVNSFKYVATITAVGEGTVKYRWNGRGEGRIDTTEKSIVFKMGEKKKTVTAMARVTSIVGIFDAWIEIVFPTKINSHRTQVWYEFEDPNKEISGTISPPSVRLGNNLVNRQVRVVLDQVDRSSECRKDYSQIITLNSRGMGFYRLRNLHYGIYSIRLEKVETPLKRQHLIDKSMNVCFRSEGVSRYDLEVYAEGPGIITRDFTLPISIIGDDQPLCW